MTSLSTLSKRLFEFHLTTVHPHDTNKATPKNGTTRKYRHNIEKGRDGGYYCRTTLRCGGVCMYIHGETEYTNINLTDYLKKQDLEIAAVKLNNRFIIFCVYRAPTGDLEYFFEQLESIFNVHQNSKTEIILCGDLNINYAE